MADYLQPKIEEIGQRIFALIDERQTRKSLFGKKDFYGRIMEWSMQDEGFKTQMFRFIDVLPTLHSDREVMEHLQEYLKDTNAPISQLLRPLLRMGSAVPLIPAALIRRNVNEMANIFITGRDGRKAWPNLLALWKENARYTVDILGEAVVSDPEADDYARRYRELLEFLAHETRALPHSATPGENEPPRVNVSVKLSALCARIQPADPVAATTQILARLRPLVSRARELGAFINLDMEHYGLKTLTFDLFKQLVSEYADYPHLGIVVQAYLRDAYEDAENLVQWAYDHNAFITVRLVKGAYWDFEKVIAAQRTWEVPVYTTKAQTDANFEKITRLLLDHRARIYPAFASHNVRSIAHAIAYAESLKLDPSFYEFQMLYGMATPIRRALSQLGHRIREYCPVGELVPGMAYLVRRLLENTSNEGFLRAKFTTKVSSHHLLRDPAAEEPPAEPEEQRAFINEAPADFTIADTRDTMAKAIGSVRDQLGRNYPLIIDNHPVFTEERLRSINPAIPHETIGWVAAGTSKHVAQAVAAANRSRERWQKTSVRERVDAIGRLAAQMRDRRYELAAWQVLEVGKTWSEADGDITEAIDFCSYYAREAERLSHGRITQPISGELSREIYLARGVAAIIAPWNFPLAILCGMTVAALVTGNTVIIKPAEQSSVIGAIFMDMLRHAGFPAGVANLLTGSGDTVGAYLVAHPDVDVVAFTGSREVGISIWETAAITHSHQRNLKKVVCEMGGKNAMVIDEDADLDEAVIAILHSAFGFQGQKCSALSRLITVGDAIRRLIPRLIESAAALKIGLPEDPTTDIGPVIDEAARTKHLAFIQAGETEFVTGFKAELPNLEGYYTPPTIFTNVDPNSRLAQEEIFGPVLAIIPARDLKEALEIANGTPYALTGGLFSRSPSHIEMVRSNFQVGNLYINRSITGAIVGRHPFGGFKMSGGGSKAGGKDYLLNFLFSRVVTENTLRRGFAPEVEHSEQNQ